MPTNTHTTNTPNNISIGKEMPTGNMHLNVSNRDLLKGIQTVYPAISSRSTLPVLGNILFQATEKGLRLSATDLEVGIRTWVKADVIENGAITIPSKIVLDFLRAIEDEKELSVKSLENNKVEIRSGRDRLNVMGLPKSDYPILPEFDEKKAFGINKSLLREIVKKTMFAASTDETRYVLNGIHFVFENEKVMAVATDGRRLAFIEREFKGKNLDAKVIVPSKTIHELVRLLSDDKLSEEEVNLFFSDNQASFLIGESVILSRLIEGHFPNFEQVIPKGHDIEVSLNRLQLLAAVTRAAVGTLERGGSVKVVLTKGTMQIQAAAQGRVEAEAELAIGYEGNKFEIAFNPGFFIDALKALDHDSIILELTSPLNPGVVRPANDDRYRYIMMPMKV